MLAVSNLVNSWVKNEFTVRSLPTCNSAPFVAEDNTRGPTIAGVVALDRHFGTTIVA